MLKKRIKKKERKKEKKKKKVSTTTPLVSGWKSDTEETSKQKKL